MSTHMIGRLAVSVAAGLVLGGCGLASRHSVDPKAQAEAQRRCVDALKQVVEQEPSVFNAEDLYKQSSVLTSCNVWDQKPVFTCYSELYRVYHFTESRDIATVAVSRLCTDWSPVDPSSLD